MRIRSTKPEFWRSKRIASVSWEARLVLKGLESYVDDNGVGKDDLALIVADIFPRDLSRNPTGTLQRVSEAIAQLSGAGLLWRYEAADTDLLYIAFWESVQRIEKPTKGRFPRPDGTLHYRQSEIGAYSGSVPGVFREDSGQEQRNRGTEEQGNSSFSSEVAGATTDTLRADVEELLDYLDAAIRANDAKVQTRGKKARDAMRLLLDKDGRTHDQVRAAIDYATTDEFWRANILSASKLREKFDQLRLSAQRKGWRAPDRHTRQAEFWESEIEAAREMDAARFAPKEIEK